MKKVDFLIVGQGIAGLLISFHLTLKGKSFMVIDQGGEEEASYISGAVLHSFNLRKRNTNLLLDGKIACALDTYHHLETLLNTSLLKELKLICLDEELSTTSFSSKEYAQFIPLLSFASITERSPVYRLNNQELIQKWRRQLLDSGQFLQDDFQFPLLKIREDGFSYQQIQAGRIVFCEGAQARENPFFPNLPFVKNKGNVLILFIPDLPEDNIYQFDLRLIPLGNHLFWLGSNYDWTFTNLKPDVQWRRESLSLLQKRLKVPFYVQSHFVAERPTTAGQQVLLCQSAQNKRMYLFNGLGTKGFTLGPFYAKEFMNRYFKE